MIICLYNYMVSRILIKCQKFSKRTIQPKDRTLTDTTILGQSGSGNNVNKGEFNTSQNSIA